MREIIENAHCDKAERLEFYKSVTHSLMQSGLTASDVYRIIKDELRLVDSTIPNGQDTDACYDDEILAAVRKELRILKRNDVIEKILVILNNPVQRLCLALIPSFLLFPPTMVLFFMVISFFYVMLTILNLYIQRATWRNRSSIYRHGVFVGFVWLAMAASMFFWDYHNAPYMYEYLSDDGSIKMLLSVFSPLMLLELLLYFYAKYIR